MITIFCITLTITTISIPVVIVVPAVAPSLTAPPTLVVPALLAPPAPAGLLVPARPPLPTGRRLEQVDQGLDLVGPLVVVIVVAVAGVVVGSIRTAAAGALDQVATALVVVSVAAKLSSLLRSSAPVDETVQAQVHVCKKI